MQLRFLLPLLSLLTLSACATAPQKAQPAAALAQADTGLECEEIAPTGSHVKQKTCHAPNTSSPNSHPLGAMDSVRAPAPGPVR